MRHAAQRQRDAAANARRYAEERFNIERFVKDWVQVMDAVTA